MESAFCSSFPLPLLVTSLAQGGSQPLQTLVQTISGGGARGLDVPRTLAEAVEAKLVGDLGSIHGILEDVSVSYTAERNSVRTDDILEEQRCAQ
jgi:hypothetical protein